MTVKALSGKAGAGQRGGDKERFLPTSFQSHPGEAKILFSATRFSDSSFFFLPSVACSPLQVLSIRPCSSCQRFLMQDLVINTKNIDDRAR